jgi:hypothetical protein
VQASAEVLPFADGEFDGALWLTRRYFPRVRVWDRERLPTLATVAAVLGELAVDPVPIAHDCSDGFLGCFWRRPEAYLDPEMRFGMSRFRSLDETTPEAGLECLWADLASGE